MSPVDLAARYPRVALTHEWLTVPGGSEKVVAALLELLPHAEIFTTVFEPENFPELAGQQVHTTVLDRLPSARTQYPKLLPLMDAAWRRFDLSSYDLVVSSSHACAKNVRTPRDTVHVSYCHTPMRYVWDPAFLAGERLGAVGRVAFRAALPRLRRTDLRGVEGVDRFVANSTVVADRIARFYGRNAEVVHPPVEVKAHLARPRRVAPGAPYLVFGRVVPYKRVDLAVRACARLGRPIVVAGEGRDVERVRRVAGPLATFVGHVSDAELADLFATSRALLFPGEEDFGIVPVEAQAAGLPVIGFGAGGVRDSVEDGVSGVLYDDGSLDGLVAAIERFEGLDLDEAAIRHSARGYSRARFHDEFGAVLRAARAGERRPAAPRDLLQPTALIPALHA